MSELYWRARTSLLQFLLVGARWECVAVVEVHSAAGYDKHGEEGEEIPDGHDDGS